MNENHFYWLEIGTEIVKGVVIFGSLVIVWVSLYMVFGG